MSATASTVTLAPARMQPMFKVLWFAVLVMTVFTFTRHRVGHNVASRFTTVQRLVDDGTMEHPDASSIDTVQIDGRIYSSKPPNYSLLLAAEAWVVKAVTRMPVAEYPRFYLWLLVFLNQVVPYALMLLVAAKLIEQLVDSVWTRTYAMAAMTFGCLPFGYSVTLNNHTPTAIFMFLAFVLLVRIRDRGEATQAEGFLVGLLSGLACTFELTAGAFAIANFGLLFLRDKRVLAAACVGALLPVVPTMVTYHAISGKWLPFYVQKDLYHYAGSYWNTPRNADALAESKPVYIFHALFGLKGMFSLTPLMFLGAAGLWRAIHDRGLWFWDMLGVAAASIAVMGYILATTNNYGGSAMGMRWFSQFQPLWVIAAIPVAHGLSQTKRGRVLCYVLLAFSCDIVVESLIQTAFKNGGWVLGLTKVLGA